MNGIRQWVLSGLAILFIPIASGRCAVEGPACCQETLCAGHVRAGCPQVVSPHARPSDTPGYWGYYAGGGAAMHGQPRCPNEGTWGWDYVGLFRKRVILDWWHGAHAQGGGGAYATDHK